jgi:hypothetical protein
MAFASLGGKRGILSDVNVVPLIDILLVLLVIFMIIPHRQIGLQGGLAATTRKFGSCGWFGSDHRPAFC